MLETIKKFDFVNSTIDQKNELIQNINLIQDEEEFKITSLNLMLYTKLFNTDIQVDKESHSIIHKYDRMIKFYREYYYIYELIDLIESIIEIKKKNKNKKINNIRIVEVKEIFNYLNMTINEIYNFLIFLYQNDFDIIENVNELISEIENIINN